MTRSANALLFLILVIPFGLQGQEDLRDYDHTLEFARYLNSSRQFGFAADEYERLRFFHPADTVVLYEWARNYRMWAKCDQRPITYQALKQNQVLYAPRFASVYLNFCLTCRTADPEYLSLAGVLPANDEAFYTLSYYWRTRQFDSAIEYNHQNSGLLREKHPSLYSHTKEFEDRRHKSPALALMMSSVLPGSGRAYSGRWGDALISFVFIGTTAYASYRAFNQKGIRSFNGWFLGGISFSFYVSNLYGSFKAARDFNQRTVTRYEDEAERIIYSNF